MKSKAAQNKRLIAHQGYAEALAKAKTPEKKRATMAYLGRTDLFFLLVYILKRADADRDFVFARCREVAADPDGYLDLWAREHYKSTIITFALIIQEIIKDPEITIAIFSQTRNISKGFLRRIKREAQDNELLKALYPHAFYQNPERQSPKWSEDDGLIFRRKGNPVESTLEAWGIVDHQPTSRHFKLRIYDDVVTPESVTTADQMKKTTDAWAMSLNLGAEGGRVRYIGTRYHFNDTYREIMHRKEAVPRIIPATIDGTVEGEPVMLSREDLAKKYRGMGPYIFGCQMLQDPVADRVQGFKQEWIHLYSLTGFSYRGMNRYILVDPAHERKERASGQDYTAMKVVGLGKDGNYYLLDMVRDRLNLSQRAHKLLELHRKYRPLAVGYERYGMQADIEHIKHVQEEENYRFSIIELGGQMPKHDRIRRLIPDFEQGRWLLPAWCYYIDTERKQRDLVVDLISEELLAFPVGRHDDMLDAMSRIYDEKLSAVFPMPPDELEAMKDQVQTAYDMYAIGTGA